MKTDPVLTLEQVRTGGKQTELLPVSQERSPLRYMLGKQYQSHPVEKHEGNALSEV